MSSREIILNRLRNRAGGKLTAQTPDFTVLERDWSSAEKLQRFQEMMTSVHGEVHLCQKDDWIDQLSDVLSARKAANLLVGGKSAPGQALLAARRGDLPELLLYDEPVDSWQDVLFGQVDASLTSTRGGIAETGSLIVWPSPEEPRLMSLVPPVHIALLRAETIYSTLPEAIRDQGWDRGMPANALLISGPSKTADIEQTLAYGVHGPKELIVLVIE